MPLLYQAMSMLVMAAYRDARATEQAQRDGIPSAINLLPGVRAVFPAVPRPIKPTTTDAAVITLDTIWEAWSRVTTTPHGPSMRPRVS
jgi:hypothetical protein